MDILRKLVHSPDKEIPKPEPVTPRVRHEPVDEPAVDPGELMNIMQDEPVQEYNDVDPVDKSESTDEDSYDEPEEPEDEEPTKPKEFKVAFKYKYRQNGSDRFYLVDDEDYVYYLSKKSDVNIYTWHRIDLTKPLPRISITEEVDDEDFDVDVFRVIKEDINGNTGTEEGTDLARSSNG